jgi:ribosomal protein S18 acetylase RimI-like enzyme
VTEVDSYVLRTALADDYDAIIAVVDDWWDRPIVDALPRLFLDHFHHTSLVAEGPDGLMGFLVGLLSPSATEHAYIHFVGVSPTARNNGLARALYSRFFEMAGRDGRRVVRAITSPVNEVSIAFHRRLGFTVRGRVSEYNGPGRNLMVFEREI